jgi:hypothetical protein
METQIFHPRQNTIKHRLKLKEELWKLKYYFTQEKIQSSKHPLKETQNKPFKISYNFVTKSQVSTQKPK